MENLLNILRCPFTGSALEARNGMLVSRDGSRSYPLVENVPVFTEAGASVEVAPRDHQSNPIAPHVLPLLEDHSKRVLNLGAGASNRKFANVVELEHKIFSTTDVVGDAHRMPFCDGVFDTVIAMNVFEHLHAPHVAAAEIFRILKPGGRVVIHTAFLQPLHEAPHHYYNATEFGVRNWFSPFHIETCSVSPNFSPCYTLAFLLSNLQWLVKAHLGEAASKIVGESRIEDWAKAWEDSALRTGKVWETLESLPLPAQAHVSAGFELTATKPLS